MNRLDKVVVSHPLKRQELDEVLEIELRQVQKRLDCATSAFQFRITNEGGRHRPEIWSAPLEARHRALCSLPDGESARHRASALGGMSF
jgi:hypothetical protein